eukprot:5786094-Amphidinium_carterae.1
MAKGVLLGTKQQKQCKSINALASKPGANWKIGGAALMRFSMLEMEETYLSCLPANMYVFKGQDPSWQCEHRSGQPAEPPVWIAWSYLHDPHAQWYTNANCAAK